MKRSLLFLLFPITLLAQEAPVFRAGAAAVDITPQEFPMNMPGGFSPSPAEKAHDPFHSRAIVMDDGVTKLAIVVVDNLGLGQETCDAAKAIATKECGIPGDRIMISSTHTHSGPSAGREGDNPAGRYRLRLIEGIAKSIVQANANLQPASMGAATHPLPEEVFNRRWYLKPGKMPMNPFGKMDTVKMNPGTDPETLDRPAGPTDPDITVLALQDAKGRKPLALWASYSLHYVGGTPSGEMSADYFGEFARLFPSRVKGDEKFVAVLSNGTSGDINNIPFMVVRPPREPFEQIRIVAQKAADTAWMARRKISTYRTDIKLGMSQRLITLKNRRPTEEQITAAKAVLAVKDPAEIEKLPRLAQNYASRALSLAEAGETITVPIQALHVGDLAFCAIPFETFVEIGLDLKKRSPFPQTVVVGISNGANGYLPTPEQHKLGGYETWLGTNRVQEDTSVILTDNLLEMLAELKTP